MTDILNRRLAGVLLHPTSLPGGHGIGDLGLSARRFVDWMVEAGLSVWQMLPLGPTSDHGSPYSSWSAFLGNPLFIDLNGLAEADLLDKHRLPDIANTARIDFRSAYTSKSVVLEQAAQRFLNAPHHPWRNDFEQFALQPWVQQATLFSLLSQRLASPWCQWPAAFRDLDPGELRIFREQNQQPLRTRTAMFYFFEEQWRSLHSYARQKSVYLFGDIPIYLDHHSADVWANQQLFQLDKKGLPTSVAGVPPDAFSSTGQLWGNPLYRWDVMVKDDYLWWRQRLARALELVDLVRIDHFRGFAAYWSVPAHASTAINGSWITGPGASLFTALQRHQQTDRIVAEDLGIIDAPVRELRDTFGIAGMHVLQFAFGGGSTSEHLPHNHRQHAVCYTGTHDNQTTRGYYDGTTEPARDHIRRYLAVDGHDIVWDFIRANLRSVANLAVVPMQDLLQLDDAARMNTPATTSGNWQWRMMPSDLRVDIAHRLRDLVALYGRLPQN